jgi:hypothetical protein
MPGRPEHRPVARGPPEARVRRAIVGTDVRLDLDDPPGTSARGVLADEPAAEQSSRGVERRAFEQRAVDDAQSARS